nr:hotdog domain-containing protein [Candidatus Sigynarchaeota archaeon]
MEGDAVVPGGKHLISSKLCKTMDLGINGNLFGGRMLEWLDESGAIFAYKALSGFVVTLKISEVLFKAPVHERDIVEIYGDMKEVGNTSITVELEAVNVKTGNKVCTCEIKFVQVNASGEKVPIPEDIKARIIREHGLPV